MSSFQMTPLLWGMILLVLFARPAHAFGAGNIAAISKVEGQNWRHGDIEDALLKIVMARAIGGKKFDKLSISRVYFGNWLRDYSQAIDVGTVKSVSAEAIRLLLCVLGFLTFGFGSREFQVTAARLGCYRPEDHIDNPKNYADNEDATQYDERLRARVNEEVELGIDEETGMKNYIANERYGKDECMTSSYHVRKLFKECIYLGRRYNENNDKDDLYEALRLLGTGLHCLEDFLAHSNYCELALIEMGERDIFPHVGRNTRMRLQGARDEVYPLVTGTFGGVDFLHSVTGEVSDKLTQNEIEELEGTLQQSAQGDTSFLRDLLDKIPDGLLGGDDKKSKMDDLQSNASASQLQNAQISPREPEEFAVYIQNIFEQINPAMEFHDQIIQNISEQIENIPILPKIVEQLEEQLSVFVFSLIAPFVVPVISQIKEELRTGSSEIIQSSENEQHIVFSDDDSTDPTHSMLAKDHFSNILNEVAGGTASKVVGWVVPQIMDAIDDESTDIDRVLNRIITGVLHHPAQRDQGEDGARDGRALMFQCVEGWWANVDQDEYRRKLSRSGVENGENHREGVQDTGHGHGCAGKLGMHKQFGDSGPQSMEDKIATQAAGAIVGGLTSGFSNFINEGSGGQIKFPTSDNPTQGGGLMGAATSLLGAFAGNDNDNESSESRPQRQNQGYQQSEQPSYGGGREESRDEGRYQQRQDDNEGSYGRREEPERPQYGGGGGGYGGGRREEPEREQYGGGGGYGGGRQEERREEDSYGGGRRDESERQEYGGGGGGYGGGRREESERQQYGGGGGYGGDGEERRERGFGGGYDGGRREESERQEYGGGGYGGGGERRRGSNDDDDERRERRRDSNNSNDDNDRRERRRSRSRSREGGGGGGWFS